MLVKKKRKILLLSSSSSTQKSTTSPVPLQLAVKKPPVKLRLVGKAEAPVPLKLAVTGSARNPGRKRKALMPDAASEYKEDFEAQDNSKRLMKGPPKFEPKYKSLNNPKIKNKGRSSAKVPISLQPSLSFIDKLERSLEVKERLFESDGENYGALDNELGDGEEEFDPMEVLRKAAIDKAQQSGMKLEPGFESLIKVEPIDYGNLDNFEDLGSDEEDLLNASESKPCKRPRKRKAEKISRLSEEDEQMTDDPSAPSRGKKEIKYEDYEGKISMTSMTLDAYIVSKSKEHVKIESIDDAELTVAKKRSDRHIYACAFCPFSNFKREWLSHLRKSHTNRGLIFCSFNSTCNLPFTCKDALDKHVLTEHQDKHTCKVCQKTFKHPYMLREHMPSHLDEDDEEKKRHVCSFCGKKFQTKRGLKSHEAHYHTKQLDHKCDWDGCDRAYFTANELVIHKRSHTGEQPFVCSYCGTGFVKKTGLNQHERAVHLGVYDKEVRLVLNYFSTVRLLPEIISISQTYFEIKLLMQVTML